VNLVPPPAPPPASPSVVKRGGGGGGGGTLHTAVRVDPRPPSGAPVLPSQTPSGGGGGGGGRNVSGAAGVPLPPASNAFGLYHDAAKAAGFTCDVLTPLPPLPPPQPGGAARKSRVFVRAVPGGAPHAVLHPLLGRLLREDNLCAKLPGCEARHGAGDYYLRNTRARAVHAAGGAAAASRLDVDHTVECQLVAHALAQTREWHALLSQADHTTTSHALSAQPGVLRDALAPLVAAHNGGAAYDFFNLRPLTPEINRQKGQLFKLFIKRQYDTDGGGVPLDLRATMRGYLAGGAACGGDDEAAEAVTRSLFCELRDTHGRYVDLLQAGLPREGFRPSRTLGAPARADERCEALGETLKDLAARIDGQ
jgi:hypothetical protein